MTAQETAAIPAQGTAIPKPNLTVVQHVYWQAHGEEPKQVDSTFSRRIDCEEQPWERFMTVGRDWVQLDHGWIDPSKAAVVVITNRGKEVLEVGSSEPEADWIVYPRDSMRATATSLKRIRLRSQGEPIRVLVFAVQVEG